MKANSNPAARLALNVLIMLGAALCVFLLGEAVTRLGGGVGYGGWGDPASIRSVAKQYYANSAGLRDREFSYERVPGERRILCLGDSFTWGQMVPANSAYPKVLERELAAREESRRVSVINAGQLGWNTANEAAWFLKEGVRYRPDVVVVGFFLNDAERDHYAIGSLLPPRIEKLLAGSYFYFFLRYRIHLLRARMGWAPSYTEYLVGLYAPGSAEWPACAEALARIAEGARSIGACCLVVVLPVISDWSEYPFKDLHERVAAFCASRGIPAVDLIEAFRASPHPWSALRVGAHDEHPNAEGHKLIAGQILRALDRHDLLDGCRREAPGVAGP